MKNLTEHILIKMAAETVDIVILRALIDAAMTRRVRLNPARMGKLTLARDLLVELHMAMEVEP